MKIIILNKLRCVDQIKEDTFTEEEIKEIAKKCIVYDVVKCLKLKYFNITQDKNIEQNKSESNEAFVNKANNEFNTDLKVNEDIPIFEQDIKIVSALGARINITDEFYNTLKSETYKQTQLGVKLQAIEECLTTSKPQRDFLRKVEKENQELKNQKLNKFFITYSFILFLLLSDVVLNILILFKVLNSKNIKQIFRFIKIGSIPIIFVFILYVFNKSKREINAILLTIEIVSNILLISIFFLELFFKKPSLNLISLIIFTLTFIINLLYIILSWKNKYKLI